MKPRRQRTRRETSVIQRISNRAKELGIARNDAVEQYLMGGILTRLGRSSERERFILKGGVLVANLVEEPLRLTRDIDLHRTKAPAHPDHVRESIRSVVAIEMDDGITFGKVSAKDATHDVDGYEGVTVHVEAAVGNEQRRVKLDVGFGDAVVPRAKNRDIRPFLPDDRPARIKTYPVEAVVAEKVETVLKRTPDLDHRMKDLFDVVALADRLAFDGHRLLASVRATLERRVFGELDLGALDEMPKELGAKSANQREWAKMQRDKSIRRVIDLNEAVAKFVVFVRPVLDAVAGNANGPTSWPPGGPWE